MTKFRYDRSDHKPYRRLAVKALIGLTALQPVLQAASSLPSGGAFVAGSGNISSSGNTLTINQNSLKGIIDWNTFSLAQGAAVNFKNGSGATLNRVTGGAASSILGQLLASGNVYILNPQGVLIGHGATIHTGGDFLASTLNLSNSAFLKGGPLSFNGSSNATVINLGSISSNGGSVYLIGNSVQNTGSISAANGTAALASGSQVLIADSASGQRVSVQAPGGDVTNSGFINAAQAELKSNGGNIYALAGNNGGQINATGTAAHDGHVWLVATNGTTNVSGQISATNVNGTGGTIETSGHTVNIADATISTGKNGNWLIDPVNLTIDQSAANTIASALNGNTNVIEETDAAGSSGAGTTSPGAGDINLNGDISWSTQASLSLSAYHDINLNSLITNTGSAAISLRADNTGTGSGTVNVLGSAAVSTSGPVGVYYNPTNAGSGKYNNPTDYSTLLDNSANSFMLVNNAADLQAVSSGNLSSGYALGTQIDASSIGNFTPIGTAGAPFTGVFDGLGQLIINLSITSFAADVGLFGKNTGTIRNIGLENVVVNASSSTSAGMLAGENTGTIAFSYVNGSLSSVAGTAGGLVGYNNGGTISNSYALGILTGPASGGLVGNNSGTIATSYSTAIALGGLDYSDTGTANSSYWDETNSGTTTSGNGTGVPRGRLQENVVPVGFDTSFWTAGSGYPYLNWQFNGLAPAFIDGNIYFNQSQTNSPGGLAVTGLDNGTPFGRTIYAGSDGYYTFQFSPARVPLNSGVITYPTNGEGQSFYDSVTSINGINMPITYGYQTQQSGNTSLAAIMANQTPALGSATPMTVPLIGYDFINNLGNFGSLNIDTSTSFSAQKLVFEQIFSLTQTSPISPVDLSLISVRNATLTNSANSISTVASGLLRNLPASPAVVISGPSPNFAIPLVSQSGTLNLFNNTDLHIGATDAASGINLGNVTIQSAAGIIVDSGITVEARGLYGTPLVLVDGTTFVNNSGSGALYTPNANWQVWSQNPAADTVGGIVPNYKQYNATYGVTTAAEADNGLLYSVAPVISPSLLGSTGKVYDGTNTAALLSSNFTFTGAIQGDTVTLATPASGTYGSPNAGSGIEVSAESISIASSSNGSINVYGYQITPSASGNIGNITPATLTYTGTPASQTYGSSNNSFSGTVTGFVNNELLAGATSGAAAFTSATNSSTNVGSYTITGSGLAANYGNYQFAQASANESALTINPATLHYSATPASQTYGTANMLFSGNVTGFVNGQTVASATTGSLAFSSSTTALSNVGSYTITGSGLAANHGNYLFAQADANSSALTIAPATLTYTAASSSRLYGSANPTFSGALTGLVNGQTLASITTGTPTFISPATSDSNVGTYAIDGSGLTLTTNNYVLAQAEGNSSALTINPALLYFSATPASLTYGSGNTIFSGNVTGFLNGQTLASSTTGSLAFSSSTTPLSNVGSYSITGSGLSANNGNYLFAQADGNSSALTINPATLFYSATPANRLYGSANPTFTGTMSGLVNQQTLASITTGTPAFVSPATAADNVGTYAINGSGLTLITNNYVLAQAESNSSALTINPATLFYSATPANRLYGSANPTFTGTMSGLVNQQTLASITTGTPAFVSPATAADNVGTYAINGSGLTLTTNNYVLAQAEGNSSALTINPATLTYVANPVSQTFGSMNSLFGGAVTGFVNGETLASATTGTETFGAVFTTSSPVGAYAINGAGLTANHGNYIFIQAPGNFTALSITAAATPAPTPVPPPAPSPASPLTITIDNATIVAGQVPVFTASYTGAPINDLNLSAILSGLQYQVSPAINGAGVYTISATGASPTGYVLSFVPGTLKVIDSSPETLPSTIGLFAPLIPNLLIETRASSLGLTQPVNSIGLFDIQFTSKLSSDFGGSFPLFGAPPQTLSQSLFFTPVNDKKDDYAAGAKP